VEDVGGGHPPPRRLRQGQGTKQRSAISAWLPPVLWASGLLLLSARPADRLPAVDLWQLDKLVHGLLYAVLGWLSGRALSARCAPERVTGWALFLAAVCLAGFGGLDEWSQRFSPGRMTSAADLVADAVGATAGLLAASRYYLRRHATHPQLRR